MTRVLGAFFDAEIHNIFIKLGHGTEYIRRSSLISAALTLHGQCFTRPAVCSVIFHLLILATAIDPNREHG